MKTTTVAVRRLSLAVVALVWASCVDLNAADESPWLTGDELRRQLDMPLGVTWGAKPLREALQNLARGQRVAIFLDRRIDPNQQPELELADTALRLVLEQIAARCRAASAQVGPVMYVGPPATAAKLWTVAELRNQDAQSLSAAPREAWMKRAAMSWPELATPRELLATLAKQVGVPVEGIEQVPHDLWAAGSLPPLTVAERFTLILAGFDLTFEFAPRESALRLVPFPENPRLTREYTPRGEPMRALGEVQRGFPAVTVKRAGPRLAVTGSAADHDAVERFLRGEKVRRVVTGPAKTVYQLAVKNQPLGAVLRTLEKQAGLTIDIAAPAQGKLGMLVSFEVKDATLEELLTEAFRNSGLKFELVEQRLVVQ